LPFRKARAFVASGQCKCYTVGVKYPSVFFAILFAWIAVVTIALFLNNHTLTYQLYVAGVAFSVIMFVIGFWRNR
jgi:hypothetical protein